MATLIPAFSSCSQRMTAGERRLARVLESHLDDDYLLWYDVPIGPKRLHPDFIVLHPGRGLFVLEVKDWKLSTIAQVNPGEVTIVTPDGTKQVKNPLEQARDYALAINKMLEGDDQLVQQFGRYAGNLICPYAYGVVLTNITRKAFESEPALSQVLNPHLVICQDEIRETIDPGEFQQRLWDLSPYQFGNWLSSEQIDRIRWHLFPDLRITSKQLSLAIEEFAEPEPESLAATIPDIIRIMDLQQEQLARSLGDGNRIIHGVAGSGKTLILAYRCQFLAQSITKPILVVCFNVSLAAKLRQMMQEKGLGDRVVVRHFHGWCSDELRAYRIPRPDSRQYKGEAYVEELVQRVIESVDAGIIPAGRYGAVLIDEGHDFQPEWLKLVAQMVDAETRSLLVLYDDAQSLYEKQSNRKFSFKSVGIQAQGRTTILKLNYRNTQEVLSVAYEFAKEVFTAAEVQEEDAPVIVQPQSAGRHGAKPDLIRLPSFRQETDYLVDRIQQFRERGTAWNEIAIVYRARFMGEQVCKRLREAEIPVEWVNETSDSRDFNAAEQSIKLLTMHSSKGLEFPIIFIPGIGFMPNPGGSETEEARLLYVAMTRAIDQLVLTCDRQSEFVKRLELAMSWVN
ncbi:3'-5' exonuclease [Leptolyngbya ohadii]|uniref:3'-5' exonuclease n=1 Tax=Leptolyngbya ohadii TaxID=1962290 RepID=UPI000B59B4D0|nr:nuclease-related domain-containing DEAD/DEAH box helicase [Leptolyngbya ohadii]